MFNRFYHFDNLGKDMIIHSQEVYDPRVKVIQIACGNVQVNRTFMINPGHRIIFRFSIWKNDVTIVNDTRKIAAALQAPYCAPYPPLHDFPDINFGCKPLYPPDCECDDYPNCNNGWHSTPSHPIYPDIETILKMYQSNKKMDYEQNSVINQLNSVVSELISAVNKLNDTNADIKDIPTNNPIPSLPENSPCPSPPSCPPPSYNDAIANIMKMMSALQEQINELQDFKEDEGQEPDYVPIPDDVISDVVNNTNPDNDVDQLHE